MKEIINTTKAPAAIGPYSQAVKINGILYTAGQIPLDPATGEIIGATIEEQASAALNNLKAIIEEAGYNKEDIVKTTCFITDINSFPEFNKVYAEFFKGIKSFPARSVVQACALPKNVLVEIEAVAVKS